MSLTLPPQTNTVNQMVELSQKRLDRFFHGMAQPTRRAILQELTHGERTVGELAAPFDMSLAAISKHIKVLEAAELVVQQPLGRTRVCRLNPGPFGEMAAVIEHYQNFWTGALDSLEQMLKGEKS